MSIANSEQTIHPVDKAPFTGDYVESGGVDIYVRHNNKKGQATILFVHGYPDMWRTWLNQMEFFAEDYQVAAMNLRGFDQSNSPLRSEDYAIDEILPDIAAVINFLEPAGGKVHLVGHDWGSALSWCFVTNPAYQNKVATYSSLSGPHPGMSLDALLKTLGGDFEKLGPTLKQVAHSWYIWLFQMPVVPELFVKTVLRSRVPFWEGLLKLAGVPADDEMYSWDKKMIEGIMTNGMGLYRQVLRQPPSPPSKGNTTPVQMIYGKKDKFLSPAVFEGYEEYFKDLAVFEMNTGHWLQLEEPQQINDMLDTFIKMKSNSKNQTAANK